METFGWCFIGCGRLAGKVAQQITASGRHRVVSVWSRNREACAAFGAEYGAAVCASAEEAITTPGVEGVYVVTPPTSHYEYVRLALELGKPVLGEKPFTVSAPQTEALIRLAEEKGIYMAEAMWTWFAPVANQVKAWLDEGRFGEIVKAQAWYRWDLRKGAARLFDPNRAGGALLEVGVYPITYLYRLFGMPQAVRCKGVVAEGIDWEEEIEMIYPGGRTCHASVSIRDDAGPERFLMEGTKASVDISSFRCADRAELVCASGERLTAEGDGSYVREFDAAAEEIRQGLKESRFVPHRATLDVMKLMDACRAQMGLVYPFER